jgi:phosphate transport system ATP-binding protein
VDAQIAFRHVTVAYGGRTALADVTLDIAPHRICAVVGPANAGKSTLLRCINRTLDFTPGAHVSGTVTVDGVDVRRVQDVCALRRRIGMMSPLPVGLPLSVYDNVAFSPRMAGVRGRRDLDALVERCLRQAALWDEVKDRLHSLATRLSGGQQQRLTIARALSHHPSILCLDEFSIAIDPVATMRIEEVLKDLKASITIVLVTNLVQQARRLADDVVFLNAGRLVEAGPADVIFSARPQHAMTLQYLQGAFG